MSLFVLGNGSLLFLFELWCGARGFLFGLAAAHFIADRPSSVPTLDQGYCMHCVAVHVFNLFLTYERVVLVSEFCQHDEDDVPEPHHVRLGFFAVSYLLGAACTFPSGLN